MIRPTGDEEERGKGGRSDFGGGSGGGDRDTLRFLCCGTKEGSRCFGGGERRPLGASGGKGSRNEASLAPANTPAREEPFDIDLVRKTSFFASLAFLR